MGFFFLKKEALWWIWFLPPKYYLCPNENLPGEVVNKYQLDQQQPWWRVFIYFFFGFSCHEVAFCVISAQNVLFMPPVFGFIWMCCMWGPILILDKRRDAGFPSSLLFGFIAALKSMLFVGTIIVVLEKDRFLRLFLVFCDTMAGAHFNPAECQWVW